MKFVGLRLDGKVMTWFDLLPEDIQKSFTKFSESFLEAYQDRSTATYDDTMEALDRVKFRRGQSVHDYGVDLRKALHDVGKHVIVDDVYAVRAYIKGLRGGEHWDKAVRWRTKYPDMTLDDVHQRTLGMEKTIRRRGVTVGATQTPTPTPAKRRSDRELLELMKKAVGQITPASPKSNRKGSARTTPAYSQLPFSRLRWTEDGKAICYKCQGEGHIGRDCPKFPARGTAIPRGRGRGGGRGRGRNPYDPNAFCDNHQMPGHTTADCFFPNFQADQFCTIHNRPGHSTENCDRNPRNRPSGAASAVTASKPEKRVTFSDDTEGGCDNNEQDF